MSQLILQPFFRFSFSNLSVTFPTWQLIIQPFRRFTYVTANSPTLTFLHLSHSSVSNPSFASPTSQALHLIYLARSAHSPTFPLFHLLHNSFSNHSVALPTLQLILSNPSVASPTSQFILQPFFRFSYVTCSSRNSPGEPPMALAILLTTRIIAYSLCICGPLHPHPPWTFMADFW